MGPMKRVALVVAWVAATFATALVAWSAVRIAGDQVGERPVEPLSAAEAAALPGGPSATTSPTSTIGPGTTAAPAPSVETTEPAPAGPAAAPASSTSSVSPSTTAGSAPPASTTTTSRPPAPAPTTTSSAVTTTTTTASAPAAETRAYQLKGGSVVIEFVPGRVTLRSASPKAGWSMEVKNRGPDEVRVEFESPSGDSDLRARWSSGRLVVDIDED